MVQIINFQMYSLNYRHQTYDVSKIKTTSAELLNMVIKKLLINNKLIDMTKPMTSLNCNKSGQLRMNIF